ncbi:MAG TPA: glycosyltransferase family 9 protein [Bryobacteraceae bacterium]|nr:glycosyltransferase family 9 protein [Bryobacteraceae bacterium]
MIRLRSLGDCVLTTPALEILKQSRPDLKLGVVVEDRFAEVFEGNPDVDGILSPRLGQLTMWRPLLCLNLHGGTRSMALTRASGARFRAGFGHHRGSCMYNVRIPRAQEILGVERKVHTAEHLASAVFFLGAERRSIPRARLFAERERAARPYAVLHPFATAAEKAWPPARFLELARALEADLEPVFIAGPDDDAAAAGQYRVERRSLGGLKSLLAGATLFVGNDSGPAHMAAALGVPVVVLYGPSDPVIWAPWQVESEVITSPEGLDRVPVDRVTRAVEQLRVAR